MEEEEEELEQEEVPWLSTAFRLIPGEFLVFDAAEFVEKTDAIAVRMLENERIMYLKEDDLTWHEFPYATQPQVLVHMRDVSK